MEPRRAEREAIFFRSTTILSSASSDFPFPSSPLLSRLFNFPRSDDTECIPFIACKTFAPFVSFLLLFHSFLYRASFPPFSLTLPPSRSTPFAPLRSFSYYSLGIALLYRFVHDNSVVASALGTLERTTSRETILELFLLFADRSWLWTFALS